MSPLILLAVIAGCVSATTIRDYTGGNSVEDILDHQDSSDDGGNEIPTLPEDNIDVEMINATIPNMHCWDYYSCASNVEPPVPERSPRNGTRLFIHVTQQYVEQLCWSLHQLLSCYLVGDYSDCPGAEESSTVGRSLYSYVCTQLDSSDVESVLRCANNYDVQLSFYTSYVAAASALNTIWSWPNAQTSDTNQMLCKVKNDFVRETSRVVGYHCPSNVGEIHERVTDMLFTNICSTPQL